MSTLQMLVPRTVKAVPGPLGWYVCPSYIDHRAIADAIADAVAGGSVGLHGVVFDPSHEDRHSELRDQIVERNGDAVLDPRTRELGSIGGFNARLPRCPGPWNDRTDRTTSPKSVPAGSWTRGRVVSWRRATPRFSRLHTTLKARTALGLKSTSDPHGSCGDVSTAPIFYSLAVSYEVFRTAEERHAILDQLKGVPIDSLWIKVSQSGALTHAAVRHLVKGAVDLHSLGVPLVGDMMGGLRGISALAFGALGGICHGVTQKERFNARSWTRTESSGNPGFTWAPRIYVAVLDMHLKRNEAEAFFEARGSKSRFLCRQRNCCPKGGRV